MCICRVICTKFFIILFFCNNFSTSNVFLHSFLFSHSISINSKFVWLVLACMFCVCMLLDNSMILVHIFMWVVFVFVFSFSFFFFIYPSVFVHSFILYLFFWCLFIIVTLLCFFFFFLYILENKHFFFVCLLIQLYHK